MKSFITLLWEDEKFHNLLEDGPKQTYNLLSMDENP
jgi:hypothetical protein